MCITYKHCLWTQTGVTSGKPFLFVNFGVADQMHFWDLNLTLILNLQDLLLPPILQMVWHVLEIHLWARVHFQVKGIM